MSATIILSDYFRRYINPEATEGQSMRLLRWTTTVWGVAGTGAALGVGLVAGRGRPSQSREDLAS